MAAACMVTRQGGESGVTAGLSAGADSGWDAEASERVAPIEGKGDSSLVSASLNLLRKPEMKDDIVNFFLQGGSSDPEEATGIYGVPPLGAGNQDGKVDRHSLGREAGCRPLGARRVSQRGTESLNSIWPPPPSAITTTWKPPLARTS